MVWNLRYINALNILCVTYYVTSAACQINEKMMFQRSLLRYFWIAIYIIRWMNASVEFLSSGFSSFFLLFTSISASLAASSTVIDDIMLRLAKPRKGPPRFLTKGRGERPNPN